MIKFNSQNSSENLYISLNFAPCGPSYDLADRCAARGGFELESPAIDERFSNLSVCDSNFTQNTKMLTIMLWTLRMKFGGRGK